MGGYIPVRDRVPGCVIRSYSELREFRIGSVVRTLETPEPRYFRRSSRAGWMACTADGCTRLHEQIRRELVGWPRELGVSEILLPAALVSMPPTDEELAALRTAPAPAGAL